MFAPRPGRSVDQLPPGQADFFDVESGHLAQDGVVDAPLLNDLFGIQARGGCSCAGTYSHRLPR